jgi:hypothetical protein
VSNVIQQSPAQETECCCLFTQQGLDQHCLCCYLCALLDHLALRRV